MRTTFHLLLTVLLGTLAAWPAVAQQQPDIAELARMKAPGRLQRLVDGATREGTFNLYTSMTAATAARVKGDFERRYPGVKVNLWRASSESVLQR